MINEIFDDQVLVENLKRELHETRVALKELQDNPIVVQAPPSKHAPSSKSHVTFASGDDSGSDEFFDAASSVGSDFSSEGDDGGGGDGGEGEEDVDAFRQQLLAKLMAGSDDDDDEEEYSDSDEDEDSDEEDDSEPARDLKVLEKPKPPPPKVTEPPPPPVKKSQPEPEEESSEEESSEEEEDSDEDESEEEDDDDEPEETEKSEKSNKKEVKADTSKKDDNDEDEEDEEEDDDDDEEEEDSDSDLVDKFRAEILEKFSDEIVDEEAAHELEENAENVAVIANELIAKFKKDIIMKYKNEFPELAGQQFDISVEKAGAGIVGRVIEPGEKSENSDLRQQSTSGSMTHGATTDDETPRSVEQFEDEFEEEPPKKAPKARRETPERTRSTQTDQRVINGKVVSRGEMRSSGETDPSTLDVASVGGSENASVNSDISSDVKVLNRKKAVNGPPGQVVYVKEGSADAELRAQFLEEKLEATDELVEALFAELENAKGFIRELVFENAGGGSNEKKGSFLFGKQGTSGVTVVDEVILRQCEVLKFAIYVSLLFFLFGQHELFLASVFFLWLSLEVATKS